MKFMQCNFYILQVIEGGKKYREFLVTSVSFGPLLRLYNEKALNFMSYQ